MSMDTYFLFGQVCVLFLFFPETHDIFHGVGSRRGETEALSEIVTEAGCGPNVPSKPCSPSVFFPSPASYLWYPPFLLPLHSSLYPFLPPFISFSHSSLQIFLLLSILSSIYTYFHLFPHFFPLFTLSLSFLHLSSTYHHTFSIPSLVFPSVLPIHLHAFSPSPAFPNPFASFFSSAIYLYLPFFKLPNIYYFS